MKKRLVTAVFLSREVGRNILGNASKRYILERDPNVYLKEHKHP